jgi:uncharacterized protein YcbX
MQISQLYYYPVKSCASIKINQAKITKRGIVYDRNWLIVDEQGKFITQREKKQMALIKPEILNDGKLKLSADNQDSIIVDNNAEPSQPMEVIVWKDKCLAFDEGNEIADWLSNYMGIKCRLVKMLDNFERKAIAENQSITGLVGFADAYPLLIIGEASLADLNNRLETSLPINRFRPNIVISGSDAYDEDKWKHISINGVNLFAAGPCARCVITTTNQETLERAKEPLATLATYRQGKDGVLFGQNYINSNEGLISVGDKILVKE